MTTDRDDTHELTSHASAAESILTELQLYGHRPFQDEPDPRPLPEPSAIGCAVADMFDALIAMTYTGIYRLGYNRLEDKTGAVAIGPVASFDESWMHDLSASLGHGLPSGWEGFAEVFTSSALSRDGSRA